MAWGLNFNDWSHIIYYVVDYFQNDNGFQAREATFPFNIWTLDLNVFLEARAKFVQGVVGFS